ncbi:MAG: hypothetical protein ABI267_01635 [Ginsengibacter sp.]
MPSIFPCSHKYFKIYVVVIGLLFSGIHLNAQKVDSVLKKLNTDYPQEKLYLQFDRSLYNPGETIWFKAYLFSGSFPSMISKTLYVELTDSKGKILQQISAPVFISGASGSLEIPPDFSGNVFVRAYTKWMLNFDSSFLYTKSFLVTTAQKSVEKLHKSSAQKIHPVAARFLPPELKFFPEGGNLILGIESRVAFNATDQNGMPVKISGEILDNEGKKITSFFCVHAGMGSFLLRPEKNQQYNAAWKDGQGEIHETLLPSAKQNGIVLEVHNLKNQIGFTVKRRQDSDLYSYVSVVAQMNQQLIYKATIDLSKTDSVTGTIPIENFPAGIVQITVFTPHEEPLAERIVFANPDGYSFKANLNLTTANLQHRGKNVITIDVPDTILSNLSVAVTDADLNPGTEEDNIYSHLLLTSDIKGYVYHPAYYFSSNADSVAQYLDLVMMTNGWRRFKWEKVLAGDFPALNYLPANYLSVNGQVKGLNKRVLPDKQINGILELKNNKKEFLNIPVSDDGKFNFSGMIFYDSAKLYYQFNKDKKNKLTSRATLDIKENLLDAPLHLQPANDGLSNFFKPDSITLTENKQIHRDQINELENRKLQTLKTVVVDKKIKTKKDLMDDEYTSGMFSNGSAYNSRIILPDDDPAFHNSINLLYYLQSRIPGLQVNPNATVNAITWRGSVTSLFVDEMSQRTLDINTAKIEEDASYILSLPMSEIAMVKIFDPPFMGAWGAGPGGAIAVYTKKAGSDNQKVKGLGYVDMIGYSPVREFYSPDYSVPAKADVGDYRTTLLWTPFILTDKNHYSVTLSFYNNDITKKIKIVIEGCNEDGKLTRIEKIY